MNENFVGQETADVETLDEEMVDWFINTPEANSDDKIVEASNANANLEGSKRVDILVFHVLGRI